ncbi:alpha/beta hydrolase [Parvibaculum sp.]|uniref:alpha/beta fold hydrolase n=1 Tax=Parvibaculum sp. TaxID=2024848 RepID=UPI0025D25CB3|nr:alpha/beta hydrolase [Parvibaculum sp.]
MMNEEMQLLDVDGEGFPYIEAGEGAPVIFLHGALGDCRTWERQVRLLGRSARAIAYTQRYFGDAHWRPDGPPFGTRCHGEDLIRFVEALGAGPVALVAWSYAGHAAFHAIRERPELFSRALIYEPGVPSYVRDEAALARFGEDAQAMFGPIFEAAGRGDMEEAVRRLIDGSGGRAGYFEAQEERRREIELDNMHTMPLLLAQEAPPEIGADDLAALRFPVTVMWGGATRPVFSIPSRAAAEAIGGSAHREIAGTGHLWPDEEPEAFVKAVREWLG